MKAAFRSMLLVAIGTNVTVVGIGVLVGSTELSLSWVMFSGFVWNRLFKSERGERMIIDILLGFVIACVIGIQALMISVYQDRFNKISRHIAALSKNKSEKNHEHPFLHGNMDMDYNGQKARVKATFYPKKMI